MVSALSPGGALEDFQGKNRDAASFNWFAAAAVRCLHSNRLPPEFDAAADAASFCWHLHSAHGTVWPVSWNQDADLTWTNEIVPIKQGGAVVITLFGGFGYTILLFFGFMLLPGWVLGFYRYMSCFVDANLLLCICVSLWLKKKGTARFSAL